MERVVARLAAVVDQIEGEALGLLVGLVHGQDPGGVDDGGIEAGLHTLVEEHGVEHVAQRRLEPEADVRDAEDRRHAGQLRLDAADGLDGLHGVLAEVLLAGAEREREGVEDQVAGFEAVVVHRQVVDPLGHPHLPVGRAGLALLVDGEADDGGPVFPGQGEDPVAA